MKIISQFLEQYPQVKNSMFDGDGDTLREHLDRDLLDMAALIEAVEAAKYNYMVLPVKEQWGIMMRSDDPLAKRTSLDRHDIYQLPLIITRRSIVRDDISQVLQLDQNKLNVRMSINLPNNANQLVKAGRYYALSIKGVFENANDPGLAFVPINPVRTTGPVMVWRKNYTLTSAATKFIQAVADSTTSHQ